MNAAEREKRHEAAMDRLRVLDRKAEARQLLVLRAWKRGRVPFRSLWMAMQRCPSGRAYPRIQAAVVAHYDAFPFIDPVDLIHGGVQ